MTGSIFAFRWNWQRLFSYAEVACFVSAWAIGLIVAMNGQRSDDDTHAKRTFASTSDSLGIQATLSRVR